MRTKSKVRQSEPIYLTRFESLTISEGKSADQSLCPVLDEFVEVNDDQELQPTSRDGITFHLKYVPLQDICRRRRLDMQEKNK